MPSRINAAHQRPASPARRSDLSGIVPAETHKIRPASASVSAEGADHGGPGRQIADIGGGEPDGARERAHSPADRKLPRQGVGEQDPDRRRHDQE